MYITYKARTESPSRNMTDSITHVSERERETSTDVIPLRAGDLCPRSSLRVSEAACTLVEYVNGRLCTLWMHADVHAGEERRGEEEEEEEETAQIRGG